MNVSEYLIPGTSDYVFWIITQSLQCECSDLAEPFYSQWPEVDVYFWDGSIDRSTFNFVGYSSLNDLSTKASSFRFEHDLNYIMMANHSSPYIDITTLRFSDTYDAYGPEYRTLTPGNTDLYLQKHAIMLQIEDHQSQKTFTKGDVININYDLEPKQSVFSKKYEVSMILRDSTGFVVANNDYDIPKDNGTISIEVDEEGIGYELVVWLEWYDDCIEKMILSHRATRDPW